MTTDRIESEIVIAASRERVWRLLTDAAHVSGWFGDAAAIDLRPGGRAVFTWAKFGDHRAVVERVEPPAVFSYRWARRTGADPAPGNATVAEFTLLADGARTVLRVVETGFASLDGSEQDRARAVSENLAGWRNELAELRGYAELGAASHHV